MAVVMYLWAFALMVAAVLRYKWFSFMLTEKGISISAGVIFQSSTTFRFDKIQDIDTFRGPLRTWLGLKSISIWTASLDQRVGSKKRPDGSILLDADTADWLKDYMSDPAMVASANSAALGNGRRGLPSQLRSSSSSTRLPANSGFVLTVIIASLIALAAVLQAAVTAIPPVRNVRRHHAQGNPAQFPIAVESGPTEAAAAVDASECKSEALHCAAALSAKSMAGDRPTTVQFVNNAGVPVEVYWRDYRGAEHLFRTLQPGQSYVQATFATHPWVVRSAPTRHVLASLIADADAQIVVIAMQNDSP